MIGYLYMIGFCLTIAGCTVFVKQSSYDNMLMLFCSSFFSIVLFGLLNIRQVSSWRDKIKKNTRHIFWINLSVTISWLSFYMYGLQYIDAATLLAISYSAAPVVSFLVLTPWRDYTKKRITVGALCQVIVTTSLIVDQQTKASGDARGYLIGTLLAILAGAATAFNGIYAEKLIKARFNPFEVIFFRTQLLLIVSTLLSLQRGSFASLSWEDLPKMCGASFFASIVAVGLFQLAVREIGAFQVSMILPLAPIAAYFLQLYQGTHIYDMRIFVSILLSSLAIFFFQIAARLHKE